MKHSKTCPQCGNEFEGRSNKMYCSDKCKMAAFKDNQPEPKDLEEVDVMDISQTDNNRFSFGKDKLPQKDKSPERVLELQVQLRKLELEHLRALAVIQSAEKDKERNFELHKMNLQHEQEKQALLAKIQALEVAPNYLPAYREEPIEMEDEPEMEDEEIEHTAIELPPNLQKEYEKLVEQFLDNEGEDLRLSEIQSYKEGLKALGRKIVTFAQKNSYNKNDIDAFVNLKSIADTCDDLIDEINQKPFFAAKVASYTLEDDWREELEECLG